jgi:hypothetical protein
MAKPLPSTKRDRAQEILSISEEISGSLPTMHENDSELDEMLIVLYENSIRLQEWLIDVGFDDDKYHGGRYHRI